MRFSSYALPALAANLAAALPKPQDFDFSIILAAPDPTFTQATGVTAQTITVDPEALLASATADISSVSVDASDVLSSTAVAHKRAAATTCVSQPAGATSAPTYAANADNAANFLANNYYSSVASAAPTPSGYSQSFLNKQASNNAFGYMGFDTMNDYDVIKCANQCTAKFGCVSFNIYFERDPSVDPNDSTCSNPSSVTMIKCVYWGGQVSSENAVNSGQWRGSFEVAIAGSNGYVTTQLATPAGYQAGVPFGKFAINAPYDAQGYNTYMGAKMFTGIWSVDQCSQYCDAQTKYNLATAPKDGTPVKVCRFFNTYLLTAKMANGDIVPQGQYCSLYTEAWSIEYATNGGQWRGKDQYTVDYSFGYAKTDAGIDPIVGDTTGAKYQARQDMTYYPSSLTSTFLPYCSSLLGYTAALTTFVPSTTITPLTTVTVVATVTALAKRDGTSVFNLNPTPIYSLTTTAIVEKRAGSTPNVLTKYPVAIQSAACSLIATSSPTTSTITASTVTVTLSTQTSFVTTTTSVAAAAPSGFLKVQNVASSVNGYYAAFKQDIAQDSGTLIYFTNDVTQAHSFTTDPTSKSLITNDRAFAAEQNPATTGSQIWQDSMFMLAKGYADEIIDNYPQPACQISNGFLACASTGGRTTLQLCPHVEALFGTDYGTGSYLVLSNSLGDGCELAKLVFTSS